MKAAVLTASPRKDGNTAHLRKAFVDEMTKGGAECTVIDLYDKDIRPCLACRGCQKDWTIFGCVQKDDAQEIFDVLMASDLIVLSSPVYSWYCTPPMKSAVDRMVYGMNKYYGDEKGPSLWRGKSVAVITTCGYPISKGADLWEEGVKRYCKHSQLKYAGMLAERHMGYATQFWDEEKEKHAREFAQSLLTK